MPAFQNNWLVPEWPAPQGVKAVFTTRGGGVSEAPFESMNLGDHVGDQPARVAANRALLAKAIGRRPVFLKQVHGTDVVQLDADTPDGHVADACISTQSEQACCIMVADCLPVLLATDDGRAIAAAHAGWRGLAGTGGVGVLESIYKQLIATRQDGRAQAAIKIIAWMGPCIGPDAFEVGPEVKLAFESVQPEAAALFTRIAGADGKFLANLPGLARLRLEAMGITAVYGNDGSPAWCTVGNASRFFSHRRDAGPSGNGMGTTGRMAACVWRE
ncbi:MAG: peptidoglycan editing factor PgeF [Polaromonas sp.]